MRVEDNSRLLIVTFLGKTVLRCLILVVSCATAKTKTKHFSTYHYITEARPATPQTQKVHTWTSTQKDE